MKSAALNFHHLRYFWVVAQEGSVTGAANRLGVAVQTISAQIAQLEESLGRSLLAPQGRRLVPTEAGRLALTYADQIFQLGERMDAALREADIGNALRLAVGISDALPKLIAYRLTEAVFRLPQQVRLVCREGEFDTLLAELALHRLDVVLTDRPAPHGGNLKVFSHALGEFEITLFGASDLAKRYRKGFPGNLDGAPLLLPTQGNALRGQIERWLETNAATVSLVGMALGSFVDRRWFALPAVVAGFLLQHAIQGWCPPLPVFRRLGVRTAAEIHDEIVELRRLRGDFIEAAPEACGRPQSR